jgi:acyl-coenzyme A thioesterase PaaI-like protein
MRAFDLVARVREHSPRAANLLLDLVIPRMIPLAGGLHVRVRQWSPAECLLEMPLSRRTRNHLGSMYFGAQMTLADLAAGVLLFPQFPPGPYAGVIRRVEADFRAKAKGVIRCLARYPAEARAELETVRTSSSGKAEAWVPLELRDDGDRMVTEVRFLVALKRFGPVQPAAG